MIALVGENGRGKTTIIENLHPFRRLISRDGNLAEHFYLKDSYRKLEFELDGKVYRSEIFIDGITKRMECYLKYEGYALNEGKSTSYDKIVEELFGSEELFLNSVFSAQKSRGIASLSSGQRRELFYELLNLNRYEVYHHDCKERLRLLESESVVMKTEIQHLEAEYERLKSIEEFCKNEKQEFSLLTSELPLREEKVQSCKTKIDEITKEETLLLEKIRQQSEIKTNVETLEKEIIRTEENIRYRLKKLLNERDENLNRKEESSTNYVSLEEERKQLEKELIEFANKGQRGSIETEILELQDENSKLTEEIHELSEFVSQEEIIDRQILERNSLREQSADLTEAELKLSSNLTSIQLEERSEIDSLLPLKEEILKIKNELTELGSQIKIITLDRNRYDSSYGEKLKSIELEIETLNTVPCDNDASRKCLLLSNAFSRKESLQGLKDERAKKLSEFDSALSKLSPEFNERQHLVELKVSELETIQNALRLKYQRAYGQLQVGMDRIKLNKTLNKKELASLESLKLDSRKKKIEEYKAFSHASLIKIENNEKVILLKRDLLAEISMKEKANLKALNNKLKDIDNQIEHLSLQKKSMVESIKKEYLQKEIALQNEGELKINQLKKLLTEIESKLDIDITDRLLALQKDKNKLEDSLREYVSEHDFVKRRLVGCQTKINLHSVELMEKENIENNMLQSRQDLSRLEKDNKDYNFLARAFDKTGIPVLKLENSGYEITSLANDLLKYFDNDFRIVFETLRLGKDKKKMKEVFDINVIDQDGICELKNKSGGERVWIETSIQLAIGILLRHQGKNLQTSFLDEQDGSLDIENALNYRQMIESAHRRADVYNTIIITHRKELLDLISQQIVLDEDGIKIILN